MTAATVGTATAEVVPPEGVAARLGETGEIVEIMVITIAAAAKTEVEAEEERRVLVVAQGADERATRPESTGAAAAAGRRHWRTAEQPTRTFSVKRLIHLLPLVRARTRTTAEGPWKPARESNSFPGVYCFLR